MPSNGPENATSTAATVPQSVPIHAPTGLANGTNSAKKNRLKIGVVNRLRTATPLQVNLQVKFAEVNRRFRAQFASAEQTVVNAGGWYRSRFTNLSEAGAQSACAALAERRVTCMVIRPS